ncbi:MAG: hypothetical protein M1820_005522 [Bogoriella megaspora]|nr:MAG: hypothetical protein M1820_005522 [Bogoriella megaspora]
MAAISSATAPNPQTESLFFTVLPPEMRNEIYSWALLSSEDTSQTYDEDSYWFRPGFRAPLKARSDLLRTCRLIYLEAQAFLMSEAEHAFWFDRGPPERTRIEKCKEFFDALKPKNVEQLISVRFFTQMYWLEGGDNLNRIFSWPNFRPEKLTITIRYSDWWFWEDNEPLRMSDNWLRYFRAPPSLRTLVLEYETLTWKKSQMNPIIAHNKQFKLRIRSEDNTDEDRKDAYLSAESNPLTEWKWNGPSKLGGETWQHHGQGDTVEYVVVVDKWKFVQGELPPGDYPRATEYDSDPFDEEEDDFDDYDSDTSQVSDAGSFEDDLSEGHQEEAQGEASTVHQFTLSEAEENPHQGYGPIRLPHI